MDNACKGHMLAAVSVEKKSPSSANKCSDKDASVERSGRCTSRLKIYKSYIFITMCQLADLTYVEPT